MKLIRPEIGNCHIKAHHHGHKDWATFKGARLDGHIEVKCLNLTEQGKITATLSALPEVMDKLDKLWLETYNYPEGGFINQLHDIIHEAMLKLGYTEEPEVQVTEDQTKPESEI